MKIKAQIFWRFTFLGFNFYIHIYPAWVRKRYRELGQQIYWSRGKPEQNELIVERAKLGNQYHLEP